MQFGASSDHAFGIGRVIIAILVRDKRTCLLHDKISCGMGAVLTGCDEAIYLPHCESSEC